jgi:hypothetical protein
VVRTLGFLIVRWGLGFVGLGPAPDDKDVEIAVPRYQLLVLPRQAARPRYTPTDGSGTVALSDLGARRTGRSGGLWPPMALSGRQDTAAG